MHSFHQSRGRIAFEVLCALAVSVSCVGTWMQTGASAMLAAAAAALLYALVHTVDMAGRKPVAVVQETAEPASKPMAVAAQPATEELVAEETAPAPRKARQPKPPRKTASRRSGTAKEAKAAETVPAEETEIVELVPDEGPATVVPMVFDEAAPVEPLPYDEEPHATLAPLFEPEPFVRQQRTVFGRKSG